MVKLKLSEELNDCYNTTVTYNIWSDEAGTDLVDTVVAICAVGLAEKEYHLKDCSVTELFYSATIKSELKPEYIDFSCCPIDYGKSETTTDVKPLEFNLCTVGFTDCKGNPLTCDLGCRYPFTVGTTTITSAAAEQSYIYNHYNVEGVSSVVGQKDDCTWCICTDECPDNIIVNSPQFVENTDGGDKASFTFTKEVDVDSFSVGDTLNYTLTLVNDGMLPLTGVDVSDSLPTGVTLVSTTNSSVGGFTDVGDGTFINGTLAVGDTAVFTVEVTVNEGVTEPLVNVGTVMTDETEPVIEEITTPFLVLCCGFTIEDHLNDNTVIELTGGFYTLPCDTELYIRPIECDGTTSPITEASLRSSEGVVIYSATIEANGIAIFNFATTNAVEGSYNLLVLQEGCEDSSTKVGVRCQSNATKVCLWCAQDPSVDGSKALGEIIDAYPDGNGGYFKDTAMTDPVDLTLPYFEAVCGKRYLTTGQFTPTTIADWEIKDCNGVVIQTVTGTLLEMFDSLGLTYTIVTVNNSTSAITYQIDNWDDLFPNVCIGMSPYINAPYSPFYVAGSDNGDRTFPLCSCDSVK